MFSDIRVFSIHSTSCKPPKTLIKLQNNEINNFLRNQTSPHTGFYYIPEKKNIGGDGEE